MHNGLSLIGRNIGILTVLLSLCAACSNVQERSVPERILSEEQMVEIYTDMMILDAVKRSSGKIYKSYDLTAQQHIYNKFNVDSILLKENIDYYNLEFEANIRIFEKVNERMNMKKDYFDSINKIKDSISKLKQKTKRDSLKKKINPKVQKLSPQLE